jgi:hypothetical protein
MTRSTCRVLVISFATCLELVAGCNRRDTASDAPPAENARPLPEFVKPRPGPTGFVVPPDQANVGTPVAEPEWRWGRVEEDTDGGRYSAGRNDWNDEPGNWELRPIADVMSLSPALRAALSQLDCTIPRWREAKEEEGAIARGEFERAGQRDIAVLCVHGDLSSHTYIFWNGDPARRETMPNSGSSIGTVPRRWITTAADTERPLEPDMPVVVDHEGIEIGCCECCSTIYYRHDGKWFSLPGAD